MKRLINKVLNPFNIEVHGKGYLQSLAKSDFKQDAFQVQRNLLKDKDVEIIFDCGANKGDVLQKYLESFPKAVIHAFEPFPKAFDLLKQKYSSNKRIILNQLAVSNEKTKSEFFVNANIDTNSLHEPIETGLSSDKQVKNVLKIDVQCVAIDDYCKENNIEKIDILKLDIQGGEYNALLGAKTLLQSKLINLIYTESYFIKQYSQQPLFPEICQYLISKDFLLQDIYHPIYGKGNLAWCDAIFLPNLKK